MPETPSGNDAATGPRAVHRALELLTSVVESGPIALSDLARMVELPPSTAMRMLRALEHWDYVGKDTDGRYVTGVRFARAAFDAEPASAQALNDLGAPVLRDLTAETGESTYLAVEGAANTCVYLREVQSTHPIRHVGFGEWEGRAVPMGDSAVGDVLTRPVSEPGYVVKDALLTPEATVVAAPVIAASSRAVIAAISVVGPSYRMTPERIAECGRLAVASSARLGASF